MVERIDAHLNSGFTRKGFLEAMSRRAAGRLTRSKLLAKGPHSGGHWPGKKLNNMGEDLRSGRAREDLGKTSGRPPTFSHKFSAAFWKNPEKFWSKFR